MVLLVLIEQGSLTCMFLQSTEMAATLVLNYLETLETKGASNADAKFLIKIDGKGVDYTEVANNMNSRILSIDFSKDKRFMEIIGTQMAS
jgi:hypothetical protein